jgi:hypothetical protein
VLQAEFSLTQVLDKPVTGRIFFEEIIRDNLGIGRPDNVGLIFGRRGNGLAGCRRAGSWDVAGWALGAAARRVASMSGQGMPGGSKMVTMSAAWSQDWSCSRT